MDSLMRAGHLLDGCGRELDWFSTRPQTSNEVIERVPELAAAPAGSSERRNEPRANGPIGPVARKRGGFGTGPMPIRETTLPDEVKSECLSFDWPQGVRRW